MKEEDVVALASLLGKEPEVVTKAIEEDGIGGFINDFKQGNRILSAEDFDKREANLRKSVIDEISISDNVPKPIYDRVKGTVLEMVEKDLAKKHDVGDYENFDDLIGKLVTKTKNPTETESELKERITQLTQEHEQKIGDLMKQNDDRFVRMRLNESVKNLPIDADGDKLNVQREIVNTMFSSNHRFEVRDDKVIVLQKNGEEWKPVTDEKLDPIPVGDVLSEYAKGIVNLKSPGSGGRGDSSSTSNSKTVSVSKYLKENGIAENSLKWAEAYKKFKAEGYEITE